MTLIKTEGLVLGFIRYSESSIITRIFTKELGFHSYIVNGVRKSQNKDNKIALFQPLTLLEMVVYDKKNTELHRFKEVKVLQPYQQIPFVIKKTSIALFLTEILNKLLLYESPNPDFFDFLKESFLFFDQKTDKYENFHLQFLLKISDFLGFSVQHSQQIDLQQHHSDPDLLAQIDLLLERPYDEYVALSGQRRSLILEMIVRFYGQQIENFNLHSLEILSAISKNLG